LFPSFDDDVSLTALDRHGNADLSAFLNVRPKFCSEFGFQSFPSLKPLQEASGSLSPMTLSSDIVELRQRSPVRGNRQIIDHCIKQFGAPASTRMRVWCWLSQVCVCVS
jgi:beta-mannosidase